MKSGWSRSTPSKEALAHRDPYLQFLARSGGAYFYGKTFQYERGIPVVIALKHPHVAREFAKKWPKYIVSMPGDYENPPAGLERTTHLTATVKPQFFSALADPASGLGTWIRRVAPGMPVETRVSIPPFPDPRPPNRRKALPPKPGLVVTGIIDDGLAFAHDAFRQGLKTRFECLWLQDGKGGQQVPPFFYGGELTRAAIENTCFARADHGGRLDEEQVYREALLVDYGDRRHKPLAQRAAHGTHVMDLATRLAPGENAADRPIIGVQLPIATTAETSGGTLSKHIIDGLRYIIRRADEASESAGFGPPPIVVNISYGLIAGPHDGSSPLETAMDEIVTQRNAIAPFRIVLPAGNNLLSRCHAQVQVPQVAIPGGGPPALRWRIQPDDRTPSFLEIWLPPQAGAPAKVKLSVTPPGGASSGPIREGELFAWKPRNQVLCDVIYFPPRPGDGGRRMILVAVAPTATLHATDEVAPSGVWQVRIENDGGPAIQADAWIQRDDSAPGYALLGRQSYFDDPDYLRWDVSGRVVEDDAYGASPSYVRREGTLNAIATGTMPLVVAGYRRADGRAAPSSACGPALPPGRGAPSPDGPDAMAPSEDSHAHRNVLAAGTRSGSRAAMNGTSVAAPLVTRLAVTRIAAGARGDRSDIFSVAQSEELVAPWPVPPPRPPRKRGGGGRLRIAPAVKRGHEP